MLKYFLSAALISSAFASESPFPHKENYCFISHKPINFHYFDASRSDLKKGDSPNILEISKEHRKEALARAEVLKVNFFSLGIISLLQPYGGFANPPFLLPLGKTILHSAKAAPLFGMAYFASQQSLTEQKLIAAIEYIQAEQKS